MAHRNSDRGTSPLTAASCTLLQSAHCPHSGSSNRAKSGAVPQRPSTVAGRDEGSSVPSRRASASNAQAGAPVGLRRRRPRLRESPRATLAEAPRAGTLACTPRRVPQSWSRARRARRDPAAAAAAAQSGPPRPNGTSLSSLSCGLNFEVASFFVMDNAINGTKDYQYDHDLEC